MQLVSDHAGQTLSRYKSVYRCNVFCHHKHVLDRYELRRCDYSLSEEQKDLQATFRQFLAAKSPIESVRAAEPTGFDPNLWKQFCELGGCTMAIPESHGGDGASLIDLTLVAQEVGRAAAPVPWIDHVCATRLLARLGGLAPDSPVSTELVTGKQIAGIDLQSSHNCRRPLIPSGAIADHLVLRDGDGVLLLTFNTHAQKLENMGHSPMARLRRDNAASTTVLASGANALAAYNRALDEWRLLTAAALVGAIEEMISMAAEFAKNRYTFGVPISTLQAISHPLADMAVAVQGGRNLVGRAAWFMDNEPRERPELAGCAFLFMAEEAARAAIKAVHIQGGLGVTTEAPATAYLLRTRSWSLAAGDPASVAKDIAKLVSARSNDSQDGFGWTSHVSN